MKHVSPPTAVDMAPALLYRGTVMHQRMRPVGHRFDYEVFSLLIDLDRLPEADALSPLFSVNGFNLLSFCETDHVRGSDADGLRAHVDTLLKDAGMTEAPARILLACYPRVLGKVFNPLSVFYAYDAAGGLTALVYQVRNTFGEDHTYVCPVEAGDMSPAGIRQERKKLFHVSPFLDMELTYHFRMSFPGETLKWRILETDADGPLLAATYAAKAKPLSTAEILRNVMRIPMLTWKILGGIHYEALRLWLKGVTFFSKPEPPARVSYPGAGAGNKTGHALSSGEDA
ncbi:DUF1365 domain-containing protein [Pseudohoeflea suaedae]|uniref:DUF1365 domain-containing protein n=1 Tax=Pseudohoeflea suaedae TaxID=877384 RepID=A0A4R5PLD5_9HYPH|nr:DUF1365 domain-containing protein [Pseudohoeflea suaedae]TDH36074.1 DUF1365 domain-containing protein [Pseudohoeflea suaedae]